MMFTSAQQRQLPEDIMAFTHLMADTNVHQHDTVAQARMCEDMHAEAMAEMEWCRAADRAFARALEAQAERGTWFGPTTWEDGDMF